MIFLEWRRVVFWGPTFLWFPFGLPTWKKKRQTWSRHNLCKMNFISVNWRAIVLREQDKKERKTELEWRRGKVSASWNGNRGSSKLVSVKKYFQAICWPGIFRDPYLAREEVSSTFSLNSSEYKSKYSQIKFKIQNHAPRAFTSQPLHRAPLQCQPAAWSS